MIFLIFCLLFAPIVLASSLPLSCQAAGNQFGVIELSGGVDHFCALFEDGKAKCWGRNHLGQLGYDDAVTRGDEPNEMGDSFPFIAFSDPEPISQISLGFYHSCAVFQSGKLKCWGGNFWGELGLGDDIHRGMEPGDMSSIPYVDLGTSEKVAKLSVSQQHNCVLFVNNKVKCFGHKMNAVLGLGHYRDIGDEPGEMGVNLPFVDLGPKTVIDIVGSALFHLAVFEDSSIKVWGSNYGGVMGFGAEEPYLVGSKPYEMGENLTEVDIGLAELEGNAKIESTCAGFGHVCTLISRDTGEGNLIKCWGSNYEGQLGIGERESRGSLPYQMGVNLTAVDLGTVGNPVEVHCGSFFTCALFDDGQIKCWGSNYGGQLGYGEEFEDKGAEPGTMGDNLPFVDLGEGRSVVRLAQTEESICALLDNGQVKCWGDNEYGELGFGDTDRRYFPTPVNLGCPIYNCNDPGCPDYSTCSTLSSGSVSCTCNDNYINNNSPSLNTKVDPYGQCTPKFLATQALLTPDTVMVSVSKLVTAHPLMRIGLEVYKWQSENEKELVTGFENQKLLLSPMNASSVELVFEGLQIDSKYQFILYPLSSSGLAREGLYNQTLDVETSCDCARSVGDSEAQEPLEGMTYQEEGFVLFRFPDISRCVDQYEVSRIDNTTTTTYISAFGVEPGTCSEIVESGMQAADDLRSSNLVVGETYAYVIVPKSSYSSSYEIENFTVQHTVQWEASVLGSVAVSGTSKAVSGMEISYQLRSLKGEVLPGCNGDGESNQLDSWCRTVTSSDGTFAVSFNLNHLSLTNKEGATFYVRVVDGLKIDDCNEATSDCGNEDRVIARLNHLSFNVPVQLYTEKSENDLTMIIGVGGGVAAVVLIIAIVVGMTKRKAAQRRREDERKVVVAGQESIYVL